MSQVTEKTTSRSRNREATEQKLIDACGAILLSKGPEGIGVNNVVEEAGVGKQLLYRYFDGLPGLVSAWLEQRANWPTAADLVGDRDSFDALSLKDKIKRIQRNYLAALREHPEITRLMASEILHPTAVTQVLESASDKIGRELASILQDLGEGDQQRMVDLSMVFYCMFSYLTMRAQTSPLVFGMDLNDDNSWARIDRLIDNLVDSYLD
ncbi:hypothetical protein BST95_11235 [Halioglobus japonicus]|uniref:TetR/AcrR family transcriptional regulator n=1 Tax=Halioglobus japonicus TaxID=930805 RepID=A0AAP8MF88_9GAMM|nr:TetR/AcrR family transcriptional regulator [Halioglobus japonicus]AQA18729.1 hypothetical protein BST95_11235 [Halioglobus japonicus]PLW86756.1 TetR/AcrR family transcriptional regulator [Halioglobus japonicus]GHD11221.1 TetR family transcriptional regulator [Halioglobus japonicus]